MKEILILMRATLYICVKNKKMRESLLNLWQ